MYVLAQKREVATQKQVKIPAEIHLYHFCNLELSCIALFFSSCVQNQSPKLSCHVSVSCKNLKDYEIFVPFR